MPSLLKCKLLEGVENRVLVFTIRALKMLNPFDQAFPPKGRRFSGDPNVRLLEDDDTLTGDATLSG